jgi:hypothetical protein
MITNTISAIGDITQAELTTALDTKQDSLTAGNNITIDVITNTNSAIGEITQEDLDTKQDTLTAGNNIIIDMITNTIPAIGEITQAELTSALDTKQELITSLTDLNCNSITTSDLKLNGNIHFSKNKYFDTIVVRRLDETTTYAINLRELQT